MYIINNNIQIRKRKHKIKTLKHVTIVNFIYN